MLFYIRFGGYCFLLYCHWCPNVVLQTIYLFPCRYNVSHKQTWSVSLLFVLDRSTENQFLLQSLCLLWHWYCWVLSLRNRASTHLYLNRIFYSCSSFLFSLLGWLGTVAQYFFSPLDIAWVWVADFVLPLRLWLIFCLVVSFSCRYCLL